MKIALAQMDVVAGRPDKNLETMLRMIDEAKSNGVDLIAFPEMCVGGYLVGDKWLEDSYCENLMHLNWVLKEASKGIAIAYGNIFVDNHVNERTHDENYHPNKDGRTRKYNAVYVFQDGKEVSRAKPTKVLPNGVQPKTLLPNYRIFDDERYFFSLQDISKDFGKPLEDLLQPFLIDVKGKKVPVAFELCEDLWCADYRKEGEALNPTKSLINNGAEYIINISASPWTHGKNNARDRRVQFLKTESKGDFVPFFYVNCIGAQNNGKNIVTFDGGSTVYNKGGKPVVFGNSTYDEELIVIDNNQLYGESQQREEEPKIAQKYHAVIRGIRHMKDITGKYNHPKFVLGLSGGIDSAVVAALLTVAVGKENVLGINMPTKYNQLKTKNAAARIAESLGINYGVIPIQELVDVNGTTIDSVDLDGSGKTLGEFNMENVQAKIRGTTILSNVAAKYNAVFTNNGNKLETAIGYATLYGDVGGAIAPIADLTKTEVFELAKYLNEVVFKREVIPKEVIPDKLYKFTRDQIAPSAELKNNQIDPMKFGYHDALLDTMTDFKKKSSEDIMQWYIEGTLASNLGIDNELINRWNLDDPKEFVKDLEWFTGLMQRSVFKRVQSPPIIITSKSSFGYDIRESMLPYVTTYKHEELREKVLAMDKYVARD